MPGRLGRSVLSLALASVVTGMSSAAVTAGGTVVFHVSPFSSCFVVEGPADTEVDLEVRAANGEFRGAFRPTLDLSGMAMACIGADILPSDIIRATWGVSLSRTFTVPRLTARADRVLDVVKGRGPANSNLKIELTSVNVVSPLPPVTMITSTDASGRYAGDFTSFRNLRGGDRVVVRWTSGAGDVVSNGVTAPFMSLWVRDPRFEARVNAFGTSTFTLRTSSGGLRTQVTRQADDDGRIQPAYWTAPGGGTLATAIGDRVTATFATDARMVIPNLAFSIDTAADTVSGSCLANRRYRVDISGSSGFPAARIGIAGRTGAFVVDYRTGDPYDVLSGDVVTVRCLFGTGDQVARRARAL